MKMTIQLKDPMAEKYYLALKPELESLPYKKTRSEMQFMPGDTLRITVEGRDMSAMRGTFNSYMNWIKIIDENINL